jgi:hypothetical protein
VPIGRHLGQGHLLGLHRALLLSRSTRRPADRSLEIITTAGALAEARAPHQHSQNFKSCGNE